MPKRKKEEARTIHATHHSRVRAVRLHHFFSSWKVLAYGMANTFDFRIPFYATN